MPRLFVEKQPVPIYEFDDLEATDPKQNVVYIKPRMGYGDRSVYRDALYHSTAGTATEIHWGQAELVLLKLNVINWSGPDFRDEAGNTRPCTADQFDGIDSSEPFWQKVLTELNRRNRERPVETSDPNGQAAGSLSTSATAVG